MKKRILKDKGKPQRRLIDPEKIAETLGTERVKEEDLPPHIQKAIRRPR